MADIIVDLPSRRDSNSSIEGSNKKYMSVQFSQTIDIQLFECHDDINASEIWYSELDYELMKIMKKQAVCDVRRIIRSRSIKTKDLESASNPKKFPAGTYTPNKNYSLSHQRVQFHRKLRHNRKHENHCQDSRADDILIWPRRFSANHGCPSGILHHRIKNKRNRHRQ